MGFRTNAYAKVWEVIPATDTRTKLRISISRKDKQTGEYIQDFSGFVDCVGSLAAKKGAQLKANDRIRLGDVDVTTNHNKEKNITYTNYAIFSFEKDEGNGVPPQTKSSAPNMPYIKGVTDAEPQPEVDDGEVDDDRLPF